MMDIEIRKRLTEFLGECWHEKGDKIGELGVYCCKKCRTAFHRQSGFRTFTTPADALDVMNKLVEMGKWVQFLRSKFYNNTDEFDTTPLLDPDDVKNLFSPDESGVYRICTLAGEFIKEK